MKRMVMGARRARWELVLALVVSCAFVVQAYLPTDDIEMPELDPETYEGPVLQALGKEEDDDFSAIYTGVLDKLEEDDILVIDFYQTWCPACRAWMPHYERAAKYYLASTEDKPRVHFAKASCGDENKMLCWAYGIKGFPNFVAGTVNQHKHKLNTFDAETFPQAVPEDRVAKAKTKLRSFMGSDLEDLNARCFLDKFQRRVLQEKYLNRIGLGHLGLVVKGPQEDVSDLGIPEKCTNPERQKKIAELRIQAKKEAAIEKRWNKQDKDALWYKIVKPIQLKLNGLLDQSGYEYRIMWVEDRYNAFEVDLEELAKRKRREEGRTEL